MTRRASSYVLALLTALAAAAPLAIPSTAQAQDDAAIQMARERFQEGVKYYDAKQYDKARAAFLQAYALKKHPAVLLNLAQSELRLAHEADAAKHFSQFLRESKDAAAAERQEAEKGLSAAKASVAELSVNVDVDGAEVLVDGNLEGRSPLPGPVYMKPGSHNVEARKDGKTTQSGVTALVGQSGSVDLRFSGGGAPAPVGVPPTGTEQPPLGMNPQPGGPPPGAGMGPGAPPPPEADTGGKPSFLSWAAQNKVAWIGGGLTVVGLAGGIGFAMASKSSYDNADSVRSQILAHTQTDFPVTGGACNPTQPPDVQKFYGQACAKYQDNVDSGDRQKTMATVGFVVAGVAAVGTVAYYFIDTGSRKATIGNAKPKPRGFRASVVPVLGLRDQGLGVVGEF